MKALEGVRAGRPLLSGEGKAGFHLLDLPLASAEQIFDLVHIRLSPVSLEITSSPFLQLEPRCRIQRSNGALNATVEMKAFGSCNEVIETICKLSRESR